MMFKGQFIIVSSLLIVVISIKDDIFNNPNTDYSFVKQYEIISTPTIRNVSGKLGYVFIVFQSFQQRFSLLLLKDNSILSSKVSVSVNRKIISDKEQKELLENVNLYKGQDIKHVYSSAYGRVEDRTFNGFINLKNDTYIIEPLNKVPGIKSERSIVYRKSDFVNNTNVYEPFQLGLYKSLKTTAHYNKVEYRNILFPDNRRHFVTPLSRTKRKRRSVTPQSCVLHVIADHTFFQNIGKSSLSSTISEMRYQVGQADLIFRSTDFDGDGYGDNIGFEILNITVYTNNSFSSYRMSKTDISVYDYLDSFSEYNFDSYCLAVAFTYRDFDKGVLGLAWIGSSSIYGPVGGICQKRALMSDNVMYSFNTALVSMLNYGNRVASYKSALVLSHEFGHSFGSPHDDSEDPVCTSSEFGNYLMYPYASDGSLPNENTFSPCSLDMIYPVIVNKGTCLVDRDAPHCGNGILEAGEECDCGDSFSCFYSDRCCTPSDSSNTADAPCTFRRSLGKVCSPKTSICCEADCTITSLTVNKVCGIVSDCEHSVTCDGMSTICPMPIYKADGSLCDSERKMCHSGVCSKSVCVKINFEQCQCVGDKIACELCCRPKGRTTCLPARRYGILSQTGGPIFLSSGSPCNGFTGYCNPQKTCIAENPDQVLKRLANIFSEDSGQNIGLWMQNNWYYVFTSVLAFVIFTLLFRHCRRKDVNVQVHAYRMGRFEQVISQANIEKDRQERKLNELEIMFDKRIQKTLLGTNRLEYTLAVARLTVFFPNVDKDTLRRAVARCSSEDVAVRTLLVSGYPMRRMLYPSECD